MTLFVQSNKTDKPSILEYLTKRFCNFEANLFLQEAPFKWGFLFWLTKMIFHKWKQIINSNLSKSYRYCDNLTDQDSYRGTKVYIEDLFISHWPNQLQTCPQNLIKEDDLMSAPSLWWFFIVFSWPIIAQPQNLAFYKLFDNLVFLMI